jgi:hypothetical protein
VKATSKLDNENYSPRSLGSFSLVGAWDQGSSSGEESQEIVTFDIADLQEQEQEQNQVQTSRQPNLPNIAEPSAPSALEISTPQGSAQESITNTFIIQESSKHKASMTISQVNPANFRLHQESSCDSESWQ